METFKSNDPMQLYNSIKRNQLNQPNEQKQPCQRIKSSYQPNRLNQSNEPKQLKSIFQNYKDENPYRSRDLFSNVAKNLIFKNDHPNLNLFNKTQKNIYFNKKIEKPIVIDYPKIIIDGIDISIKYKEEFNFDEDLPNYAEKFSDDSKNDISKKIELKCNYIKENLNQRSKKLKIIILNDINKENPKNYIKENYRFKRKYGNYKNLVDELVLSRKDINENQYQKLNHNLDDYNLYAEVIDTLNSQIYKVNEIDNIRNRFAKRNANIDSEINIFITLCLNLIVEYLKFELVKEVKFNQCQQCGAKCIYILFKEEQKRIVEETKLLIL